MKTVRDRVWDNARKEVVNSLNPFGEHSEAFIDSRTEEYIDGLTNMGLLDLIGFAQEQQNEEDGKLLQQAGFLAAKEGHR